MMEIRSKKTCSIKFRINRVRMGSLKISLMKTHSTQIGWKIWAPNFLHLDLRGAIQINFLLFHVFVLDVCESNLFLITLCEINK